MGRLLSEVNMPTNAFTAFPGVSLIFGPISNLESMSSVKPDCSNRAMAKAGNACTFSQRVDAVLFSAMPLTLFDPSAR